MNAFATVVVVFSNRDISLASTLRTKSKKAENMAGKLEIFSA